MKKVWIVIEDGVDLYGDNYTKKETFDTEEKAKEFLAKRVAEVKEDDPLYEDYKEQLENGWRYYFGDTMDEFKRSDGVVIKDDETLRRYKENYKYVEPDDGGVVMEETDKNFSLYRDGWYDAEHIEINIEEKEVK